MEMYSYTLIAPLKRTENQFLGTYYTMAAEVKELFEGKWKLYKNENYDKYLDNCGKSNFVRYIFFVGKITATCGDQTRDLLMLVTFKR